MIISNKTNWEVKREPCVNDVVFLYYEGKHTIDSFTKTCIRFKSVKSGKVQTINKNTFLKKHFFTTDGFWTLLIKIKTINTDYI